jgi:hypothetical protein
MVNCDSRFGAGEEAVNLRFSPGDVLVGSQVLPLAAKAAKEDLKRQIGEDIGGEFSDTDKDN